MRFGAALGSYFLFGVGYIAYMTFVVAWTMSLVQPGRIYTPTQLLALFWGVAAVQLLRHPVADLDRHRCLGKLDADLAERIGPGDRHHEVADFLVAQQLGDSPQRSALREHGDFDQALAIAAAEAPQPIAEELQRVADSPDPQRRARERGGRRRNDRDDREEQARDMHRRTDQLDRSPDDVPVDRHSLGLRPVGSDGDHRVVPGRPHPVSVRCDGDGGGRARP